MNLETVQNAEPQLPMTTGAESGSSDAAEFDAFSSAFDKLTADAPRDEAGRFAPKDGEARPEQEAQAEGVAKPEPDAIEQEAQPKARSIPANWTPDMADILDGMDDAKASRLTEWSFRLHRQMSDLGRSATAARQFEDVARRYSDVFTKNGVAPHDGFERLLSVQSMLDADPIAGIATIAEAYGVKDRIFARSENGEASAAPSDEAIELRRTVADLRQQLSGLTDGDAIDQRVSHVLEKRTAEDLIGRFASSKPHYAEVEAVLPDFIRLARRELGEGAAAEAVLEQAYDMAINAIPNVRSKVKQAAIPVAADATNDRAEKAKKAASINIASQPSGKSAPVSEDQAMEATWSRLMNS